MQQNKKNDNWNYIVWVGACDDYYKNYDDAKRDYDEWVDDGYDDVHLYKLLHSTVKERKQNYDKEV